MKSKNQKVKKESEVKAKRLQPDDQIKTVPEESNQEPPKILKMVKRKESDKLRRRGFIKNIAGVTGIAAITSLLSQCKRSEYLIDVRNNQCRCHTVCSCDTVGKNSSQWDSQRFGDICICDTVCTCNTVCTCQSQGSSCGGTYWYPN